MLPAERERERDRTPYCSHQQDLGIVTQQYLEFATHSTTTIITYREFQFAQNLKDARGEIVSKVVGLFNSLNRKHNKRYTGLSITELLVVITIIALLLGVTLPGLSGIRNRAASIKCLTNLRSLGQAISLYLSDYDGRLPQPFDIEKTSLDIRRAIETYAGDAKIFVCPRDPVNPIPAGGSYDWRFTDDPSLSIAGIRIDILPRPSEIPIGGDRHPGWHSPQTINVLFADNHVEQMKEDDWFRNIRSPLR